MKKKKMNWIFGLTMALALFGGASSFAGGVDDHSMDGDWIKSLTTPTRVIFTKDFRIPPNTDVYYFVGSLPYCGLSFKPSPVARILRHAEYSVVKEKRKSPDKKGNTDFVYYDLGWNPRDPKAEASTDLTLWCGGLNTRYDVTIGQLREAAEMGGVLLEFAPAEDF